MSTPKDLPKGVIFLNMDSPTFFEDFASAIGEGPFEVSTPQFERTDGMKVGIPAPVADPHFWETLHTWEDEDLKRIGMQLWGDDFEAGRLWCIPGEWYDAIPQGTLLTSINWEPEVFSKGVTDNDIRFGCLAFGICKK